MAIFQHLTPTVRQLHQRRQYIFFISVKFESSQINYYNNIFYSFGICFIESTMDSLHYDLRESKNSYDRRLTIFKNRMGNPQVNKPTSNKNIGHLIERQSLYSQNNLYNAPMQDQQRLTTHISLKKSSSFIKFFINQLKKIRNHSKSQQRIKYTDKIRNIQQMYDFSSPDIDIGQKGWQANEFTDVIINILTVLMVLFLHFLSTFQFLFQDFRAFFDGCDVLNGLVYTCVGLTFLKIGTSFVFVKVVVGKKLEFIHQIAIHYVTGLDFYLDLLVLVSGILLITFSRDSFAGIFGYISTIMNMAYLERLQRNIVIILNNNTKKQIFALIKLILANFWIVHFTATLLIGLTLVETGHTWIDRFQIWGEAWWVKYFYGTYWSVSIMATVGFGDIVPNNINEAMALTVIILSGCLILSYNIAQVGNIVNSLVEGPNEVKAQLSILKRLARETKLDPNLHHSIGEYIVHAAEIKRSFEIKQRIDLINMLPSQMKEQFQQYSSKQFCSTLPFFFMLQPDTKRLAMSKLKLQVISPNQYITHKKLGLTKIWILRKGMLGLAYKRKGSRLNGTVLETITVNNEVDNPQLLNIYLLVRGKRLVYDIICQEYSVVGCLEYEDFFEALKQSEGDFQMFHQSCDGDVFRENDWVTKKCDYCRFKHSLFLCPKLHYMPMRSLTFMKHQMAKSKEQKRAKYTYNRQKNRMAKRSPVKMWKNLFALIQNIFDTQVQKNQLLRVKRSLSSDLREGEEQPFQRSLIEQYLAKSTEKDSYFQLDMINDFKFYFHKQNANNLVEKPLNKDMPPIILERIKSIC